MVIDLVVKFRIRSVHTLIHAELVQISPVRRIKRAAAVVLRIGVMIRDAFAARIVIGAHHASRHVLRPSVINAVCNWFAGVMVGFPRRECREANSADQNPR